MWQASPFCQNSISATQNASQYLVWPPRACMHAWQRRGMLLMRRRMVSCGMSSQICLRASVSSCKVWGATWRRLMDRNYKPKRVRRCNCVARRSCCPNLKCGNLINCCCYYCYYCCVYIHTYIHTYIYIYISWREKTLTISLYLCITTIEVFQSWLTPSTMS